MTDRMDCQYVISPSLPSATIVGVLICCLPLSHRFLMGVFTYVYYSSLIRQNNVTVGSVLQTIVSGLTLAEQLDLMADLKRYLESQGVSVKL